MKLNKTEFPKGWDVKRISDCCKIKHGKPQHLIEDKNGKYPILASGGCIGKTNIFLYNKPSVLVGRKGTIDKPQYMETPFWTVDTLFYSEIFENIYPKFLYYLFNKINWKKYNEGSTLPSLTSRSIESIKIPVPPIGEQERIAEVLSCWDKAIEENLKIIALKEKRKKALMQSLLSGKLKFPIFALAKLGVFSKGIGISKKELSPIGVPCIRYGEIYTKHNFLLKDFYSFINPLEVKKIKEIKKGDILFASSGETKEEIGKSIAYIKEEKAFAGGDIIIFSPNQKLAESIFLSYYLNTVVRRYISKMGQGNSVVHIYKHNLEKIKISLPPLAEQEKIADILSVADEEISLHKGKVELLKKQKKYLMQVLLTGKIRLKI